MPATPTTKNVGASSSGGCSSAQRGQITRPCLRILIAIFAGIIVTLLSACATGRSTEPEPMTVAPHQFPDGILAIMPIGTWEPGYTDAKAQRFHASWFPRTMYGKGEVTTIADPYEAFGLTIFNRMRGNNSFKRAFLVKDRAEANLLGATHLVAFKINDCYAVGRGANWNFIEWISYEAVLDVHIAVYDIAANRRIQYQHVESKATSTSPWSSPDVREFLRLRLLEGVAFNNAVSKISF